MNDHAPPPVNAQAVVAPISTETLSAPLSGAAVANPLTSPATPKQAPRVFISYKRESAIHMQWVARLAGDLINNGVTVVFDQWDLQLGSDLTLFMESGIRTADRVLLVCTPAYKRKADEREGGVGYEGMVVTGEIAKNIASAKFIPVLRDGTQSISVPTFLGTKLYVSFVDDTEYSASLDLLLRELHQVPVNPRPQLGANPYISGQAAAPVVQSTAAIQAPTLTAIVSPEEAYAKAESILRQRDLLGWSRLVRNTTSQIWPRLLAWRQQYEAARVHDPARWAIALAEAVGIASSTFVLALSAVESNIPEIRQQRALLDELLSIDGWNSSGYSQVIAAPTALGMAYHFVLGAFMTQQRNVPSAVELLTSIVRYPDSAGTMPLWQADPIMGWSKALGGDCTIGWKWILGLYQEQPWLAHFFSSPRAFETAIEDYAFLASLVELASQVKAGTDLTQVDRTQVPPLFLPQWGQDLAAMIVRVVPERRVVQAIAQTAGVTTEALADAWPQWALALSRTVSRYGRGRHGLMVRAISDVPRFP